MKICGHWNVQASSRLNLPAYSVCRSNSRDTVNNKVKLRHSLVVHGASMSCKVVAKENLISIYAYSNCGMSSFSPDLRSLSCLGADFAMKVTDKNYLDTQGFSVFLYDSTYHPFS